MSHITIIISSPGGSGKGGEAKSTAEWKPTHEISPRVERRRREKAVHMLAEIDDMLYAPPRDDEDDNP